MNLLWYQVCTLHSDALFFLRGEDIHIRQHIHKKDSNLCLPSYYSVKVIVDLAKTQTRNSTVIMLKTRSRTKYFVILLPCLDNHSEEAMFGSNQIQEQNETMKLPKEEVMLKNT